MKGINRIWLFPLLYLVVIGMHPFAHALNIESDQQLNYADTLFSNERFLRAAEEYQRFTFFFPDHPKARAATFKAGESFLLAKDPVTAVELFKSLASVEPPDKLAIESYFKLSDCYLALNTPTHAVVQLNNAIALSDTPATKDRAYYKIGWIHIEYANWEGATAALARLSPSGQQHYRVEELNHAISETSTIPTKNPTLAGALSVVPGAGQLYCNRYEDAFIAFAVNIGLIWAAYDAFDNEQYGLGGLLSFVGIGFYAGNIYGAANDAHKYNHQQTRHFIDQLKQYKIHLTRLPSDNNTRQGLMLSLKIPF
jgi:tetratricopeptide (TPR) repeat protein